MKKSQITKEKILSLIEEQAYALKRKQEIFNTLKEINEELKTLNESQSMVGTFGFKAPNDGMTKSAHATGFVNPQNISHVAQLEKEMGGFEEKSEPTIDEVAVLKQENETLKKQLEEITAKMQETSSVK